MMHTLRTNGLAGGMRVCIELPAYMRTKRDNSIDIAVLVEPSGLEDCWLVDVTYLSGERRTEWVHKAYIRRAIT